MKKSALEENGSDGSSSIYSSSYSSEEEVKTTQKVKLKVQLPKSEPKKNNTKSKMVQKSKLMFKKLKFYSDISTPAINTRSSELEKFEPENKKKNWSNYLR